MPRRHYASTARTRELLSMSLEARQLRLAAADMIFPEEAAKLLNTNCVMINGWITSGRAIGLRAETCLRMPRWQFDPMLWDAIAKLSEALGTTNGWELLAFLETPQGALGGRTPRQALEQGEADRVVALAEQEDN